MYFCDQCNHTFNLKCFYQIPLTWWKNYVWEKQPALRTWCNKVKDHLKPYSPNILEKNPIYIIIAVSEHFEYFAIAITYNVEHFWFIQGLNIFFSLLKRSPTFRKSLFVLIKKRDCTWSEKLTSCIKNAN